MRRAADHFAACAIDRLRARVPRQVSAGATRGAFSRARQDSTLVQRAVGAALLFIHHERC